MLFTHWRYLSGLILLVCSIIQADESEEEVITELAWGEALYFQFKGDSLEALTRLSARMKQGALIAHKNRAEILTAGILLDYGLPTLAADKLALISTTNLNPKVAAKLHLANARVFFEQQHFQAAQETLLKVDKEELSAMELSQASFMTAQIQFSTGDFSGAATTLSQTEHASNLQLYAKYNQGISLLQTSNTSNHTIGLTLLKGIIEQPIIDQEIYALVDQAKLAIGLHAIGQANFSEAQSELQSIRLNGLVSNDALLLLGWSYAGQEDYSTALNYWTQVAGHEDILSPIVQEAWLAVPYAWQKNGDRAKARAGYETALVIQNKASVALAELRTKALWKQLLNTETADSAFAESPTLYRQLIANAAFHELKNQWNELHEIDLHLIEQSKLIPTLELVVKEHRQRFFNKSEQAKQRLQTIDLQKMDSDVLAFREQLDVALKMEVAPGLLSKEEEAIWNRIQRSESNLVAIKDESKADQLRRIKGVAKWQFHRQRKANEWQAINAQNKLEKALVEMKIQHEQLQQIVDAAQPPIEIDVVELNRLNLANKALRDEIKHLKLQLEFAMANVYDNFIQVREDALVQLAEQAYLALARLSYESATGEVNHD